MSEKLAQDASHNPAGVQPTSTKAAPARPKTVETAFWLLVAAAVLVLVRIAVGIAVVNSAGHKETIGETLGTANIPFWVEEQTSGYVWSGIITAVILGAIALLSRMGYGWPRIVLILVTISTALNTRVQFFASIITVYETAWVTLVSVLLTLAAVVLLFLAPSGTYFKSMRQYRKGRKLGQA